jgi:ATP adenylyltransferase
MRYLSGATREDGCIFCNRIEGSDDVSSLILHRAVHSFVIVNLYPYSSGHIMIVPNQHAADPAELDTETRHEMADLLPMLTTILRRTLNCEGFNSGFNFGVAGGAGIEEHLHQHIVPRWIGDANFMPLIASTKVIPETIPVGYAKIRSEIEREITGGVTCPVVALVDDDQSILLQNDELPVAHIEAGVPVWKSAISAVRENLDEIEIAGWAGPNAATPSTDGGLVVRGKRSGTGSAKVVSVQSALELVPADQRECIERGLKQLAPRA